MQLFLDCDGVLADFEQGVGHVFGASYTMAVEALGEAKFWARVRECKDFHQRLPLMEGALALYAAVQHLRPIILTGRPAGQEDWVPWQKQQWAARYFPGVEVIICASTEKRVHTTSEHDVLVDDRTKYRHLWPARFVLHTSAAQTIGELRNMGVL